jgi:carbamoyl-phosphate synthase small subunit
MSENLSGAGFTPGADLSGVSSPHTEEDAADRLIDGRPIEFDEAYGKGVLLLADGGRYEGTLFGASVVAEGELVFTTGMTGFQESLTDPSFAGQVLTFTWPLLGNYGVIPGISESSRVWPRGVVCRQAIEVPDHRDAVGSLHDLLHSHGVPGIQGVDTRSITRRVREYGTLLCVFGPLEHEEALSARLAKAQSPDLEDLVNQVSRSNEVILNQGATDSNGTVLPRLIAIDCGVKFNILRELCRRFEVVWVPAESNFEKLVSQWNPDAFFCSNGPGDPAHSGAATSARRVVAQAVASGYPTMGICLGHQLLGLASGLRTYKLLYGHRGANQPVVDLMDNTVSITSQNHGFAIADPKKGMLAAHPSGASSDVEPNAIDSEVTVRFVNANDRTVEGLDVVGRPAFSVQYHPEACPGPHDANPLFDRFSMIVAEHLGSTVPTPLDPVATPSLIGGEN